MIILIIGKSCGFSYSYDDAVFALIPCTVYITFSNMGDGVFKSFNLLIPCTDFTLYTNTVKLDSPNNLLISILHMNDGLLTLTSQVRYHLISQRLLNL